MASTNQKLSRGSGSTKEVLWLQLARLQNDDEKVDHRLGRGWLVPLVIPTYQLVEKQSTKGSSYYDLQTRTHMSRLLHLWTDIWSKSCKTVTRRLQSYAPAG